MHLTVSIFAGFGGKLNCVILLCAVWIKPSGGLDCVVNIKVTAKKKQRKNNYISKCIGKCSFKVILLLFSGKHAYMRKYVK